MRLFKEKKGITPLLALLASPHVVSILIILAIVLVVILFTPPVILGLIFKPGFTIALIAFIIAAAALFFLKLPKVAGIIALVGIGFLVAGQLGFLMIISGNQRATRTVEPEAIYIHPSGSSVTSGFSETASAGCDTTSCIQLSDTSCDTSGIEGEWEWAGYCNADGQTLDAECSGGDLLCCKMTMDIKTQGGTWCDFRIPFTVYGRWDNVTDEGGDGGGGESNGFFARFFTRFLVWFRALWT